MSSKFTYDGYTITVAFKNDFCLSMTASLMLTGEHFMNDMVQLTKIKKDTVLATLSKKSEKNLRCEFNMVDSDPRKLIISFVVSFDYLPEFRQDVTLIQIEAKNEQFNKVSSAEIQSDINAIERILDSINEKGTIIIRQKTLSLNNKTEVEKISAEKGKYLLQISGIVTCPTAAQQTIEFIVQTKNEKPISLQSKMNCMSSYGYPYMISKQIDLNDDSDIVIFGHVKNTSVNSTLANHMVTLTPIVCLQ